jgi:hypothetical protein
LSNIQTKIAALAKEMNLHMKAFAAGDRMVGVHVFGVRNWKKLASLSVNELGDVCEKAALRRSLGQELRKAIKIGQNL